MLPLINPGDPSLLGRRNVVLTGPGSRATPPVVFTGPLSVKSALEGRICFETAARRHIVAGDTFVLLNDGQEYRLEAADDRPGRTFCVFFERGFVEQAARAISTGHEALLDRPERETGFGFFETLTPISSPPGTALRRMAAAVRTGASPDKLDWLFHDLARALAEAAVDAGRRPERLGSVRPGTRREIHRRLLNGRAAIEDEIAFPWTLRAMARQAAMAPHHFARCFSQCFGEPPRRYLSRRRLEKAKVLLDSGRFSVTETCFEVGYASIGSFSAAYRRHHGHPPSSGPGMASDPGPGRPQAEESPFAGREVEEIET